MEKGTVIIGIDPDNNESGVGTVYDDKTFLAYKMEFPALIDYLKAMNESCRKKVKVVIEGGWLNKSNWHVLNRFMSAVKAAAIGRSTGMNHQTGILIIFYFGRLSCYSLLTSFIAIPAATFILYLCALLFILSPLTYIPCLATAIEGLMQIVMNVLTAITQFINTAFKLTSMLPGASIEHIHLSLLQLLILYIAILAGYFALRKWYRVKEKEA